MSRPAKSKRVYGNRYTGARMTAREAQTLTGIMRKLRIMQLQMEQRGVWIGTTRHLIDAHDVLLSAILDAGRSAEL